MATIRKRLNEAGTCTSYQVDYRDPAGKRKMRCFKKRKDASAFKAQVEVSLLEGTYGEIFESRKVRFEDLVKQYLENFRHQKAFRDKKRAILTALEEFRGKQLHEIAYMDLELYRNKRKATPTRRGQARTEATVNRELAALRNLFSKAVQWNLLATNPFHKGEQLAFKEHNQRQRYLTEAEIDRLLTCCSSYLRPIVELALHTGLRKGELLGLTWDQIRDGFIYLRGGMTKSGKGREVPLDARAAQVVKEQQIKNKWKSPYVCVGPDGIRLQDIKKGFAGACRRAGIDDCKFHDLRHTFASHLVMKGANLKAVQRLLGHADAKMTDRYSHLSPDHLRESVNLLSDLPSGKEMVNILQLKTRKAGAGKGI